MKHYLPLCQLCVIWGLTFEVSKGAIINNNYKINRNIIVITKRISALTR